MRKERSLVFNEKNFIVEDYKLTLEKYNVLIQLED